MYDQGTAKTPKGYKGLAMEGVIAKLFARIRKRSMEELKSWAIMINAEVSDGGTVLEVAPGPGYLAIELARLGNYKITGLDISKTFVEIAQKNANEAGVNIDFRQGDAGHMPFGNDIFDFIVCTTAFKDFAEPVNALNEMHRVLRPSGKALIIDHRPDAPTEALEKEVNDMHLGRLSSLITKWALNWLAKRASTIDEFTELVSKTSFGKCTIEESGIVLEIGLQK